MAIDKSIFDLINQDKPADLKDIISKELETRIKQAIDDFKQNEFPKTIMGKPSGDETENEPEKEPEGAEA